MRYLKKIIRSIFLRFDMPLYDFKCQKGHIVERLVDNSIHEVNCPECANQAFRIISSINFSLDPISGDFPKATKNWAKWRQVKIAEERKTG